MGSDLVLVEQMEGILRIVLNRPGKKNALIPEMYATLKDALEKADVEPEIRVIYLTGSGDAFCAGNDLFAFINSPHSPDVVEFVRKLTQTATPIVAAVNGIAVGVGVTMLLHCDLVYANESAVFDFAFIDLGAVPEAASSYLLPRLIGQHGAAELLMLGGRFGVEKAREIGLVNGVLPAGELQSHTWKQAKKLASKPPEALRQTKALLKRGTQQAIAETLDVEFQAFAERLASEESRAIISAIVQRWADKNATN